MAWSRGLGLMLLVLLTHSALLHSKMPAQESPVGQRSLGHFDPGVDRQTLLREQVGITQNLGDAIPLDDVWIDEMGEKHTFRELMGKEKPVLLVPAYFRCRKICNQVLNGVFDSLKLVKFQPGKDFELVVFSFDEFEGPGEARQKKEDMMATVGRKRSVEAWRFWTGSPASIEKLTKALGYRFIYEKEHDELVHAPGIMAITPTGLISRYLLEIRNPGVQLELALSEASGNRIGTWTDKVKLLCYTYDPASGRYSLAVMRMVQTGFVLTVLSLVIFMGWNQIRRWLHLGGMTQTAPNT